MLKKEWKKGVAFVRGINMFAHARITKKEMQELCKQVEGENVTIEALYKADNILFKKRNMHYASVGQRLESVLSDHFDKEIHVTCRSMRTIRALIQPGD